MGTKAQARTAVVFNDLAPDIGARVTLGSSASGRRRPARSSAAANSGNGWVPRGPTSQKVLLGAPAGVERTPSTDNLLHTTGALEEDAFASRTRRYRHTALRLRPSSQILASTSRTDAANHLPPLRLRQRPSGGPSR
jgi:hypothetical protein